MDRTIEAAYQMGLTIKWLRMDKEFIWQERKKWEEANNKTPVYYDRYEGPQKLVVSQFTGLFLLTLIGLCMAATQFLAELFKFKKGNRESVLGNETNVVVREVEKENDSYNNNDTNSNHANNGKQLNNGYDDIIEA